MGGGHMGEGRGGQAFLLLKARACSWTISHFHFTRRKTESIISVVLFAFEKSSLLLFQSPEIIGRTNAALYRLHASSFPQVIGVFVISLPITETKSLRSRSRLNVREASDQRDKIADLVWFSLFRKHGEYKLDRNIHSASRFAVVFTKLGLSNDLLYLL